MKRREKIELLEQEKAKEIAVINEKYRPLFKELEYKFTLDEIIADGWIKSDFYPAMSSSDDHVYYYIKGNVIIFIHQNPVIPRKITAMQSVIYDMEDLNDYYNEWKDR